MRPRLASLSAAAVTVAAALAFALAGALPAQATTATEVTRATQASAPAPLPTGPVAQLTIDRFDAVFDLHRATDKSSSMDVTETISVRFPDADVNHGIERAIPTDNDGIALDPEITSVTDGSGTPESWTTVDDSSYGPDVTVLRIGDANTYVHGPQTYVIKYTLANVVRYFSNTDDDELYWDVSGTGWQYPIGVTTVTVNLHDGTDADLTGKMACYPDQSEASLASAPCVITRDGSTITSSVNDIVAGKTLTVAIGFHPGSFADPPNARDAWYWRVLPWVFLALAVLSIAWVVYVRVGPFRDAKGRGIIVPEYDAPAGMWPMLAADFLQKGSTAFPAELVGLAVRKYVSISENADAPARERYTLTLLSTDWSALDHTEASLLAIFFPQGSPTGTARVLDQRDRTLGDAIVKLRASAPRRVTDLGLRAKSKSVPNTLIRVLLVLLILASIVHAFFAWNSVAAIPAVLVPDIAAVVLALVTHRLTKPRLRVTDKGAEVRDHLAGLKEYIQLAEKDRIAFLQSPKTAERIDVTDTGAVIKLYEKVLPYAMVLGVSDQWTKVLQDRYATTPDGRPDWYYGQSFLALAVWNSTFTSSSFATTPSTTSSSSFGGSGGGGFSGGGGGGGGGGGW